MMIPEKIYVPEEEFEPHQDGMGAISYSLKQTQIFNTELTRAPIAKRFDVEKPKDDGWYLARSDTGKFIPRFYMADDNTWYKTTDFRTILTIAISEWCEIIAPDAPE